MEQELFSACALGKWPEINALLKEPNVNINCQDAEGATPFFIACREGQIRVVKLLLSDERVDVNLPDCEGRTPFFWASFRGRHEVAKLLVSCDRVDITKPNKIGETPFLVACQLGHTFVVQYILACGKEINMVVDNLTGMTALEVARERDKEAVADLLESFTTDPVTIRTELRKRLGFSGNFFFFFF